MTKFIFAADLHLRADLPLCRKDADWIGTQRQQLDFVARQCIRYNCPLVIGGDLCHTPQIPDNLKNIFIDCFKGVEVYAIAGQHCLPYHQWNNVLNSSFGVLLNSGVIKQPYDIVDFKNYGGNLIKNGKNILLLHESVFKDKKSIIPGMKAKTAQELLDEYPDYEYILCGDIHHGFSYISKDNRFVLMAGCLNRQASSLLDYIPVIHYIDTDKNTVTPIPIPDDVTMVSDDHIIERNERDNRIEAFVKVIKATGKISLDYLDNVREAIKVNEFSEDELNIIEELIK